VGSFKSEMFDMDNLEPGLIRDSVDRGAVGPFRVAIKLVDAAGLVSTQFFRNAAEKRSATTIIATLANISIFLLVFLGIEASCIKDQTDRSEALWEQDSC
jgi:hypothetical protein